MSSEGRTVKVKVIAEPDANAGEVTFKLDSELKDDEDRLVFDQDRDEMRKLDYYLVEFELDDRTDLDLQFAPRKEDAFWVVMGRDDTTDPPCPKQPSHSDEIHRQAHADRAEREQHGRKVCLLARICDRPW